MLSLILISNSSLRLIMNLQFRLSLLSLLGFAATSAHAATVTYVGFVTGTEATSWRTVGVTKTMSITGSNIYGSSLGAVDWGNLGLGENGVGTLGWSYRGLAVGNGQYGGDGRYPAIDNINPGGGDNFPGIIHGAPSVFTFGMEGSASTYSGMVVRVGVFGDTLGADEIGADTNKTYRLTGPGGGDSGVISLRGGAAGTSTPEIYFFDITNITAGDGFQLTSTNNGGSGQAGYIGPMSWDVAPVPEPSVLSLSSLLGVGLLLRRRK
jgi:hypothetical protein